MIGDRMQESERRPRVRAGWQHLAVVAVAILFVVACGGRADAPGVDEPRSDGGVGEPRESGAANPEGSTDGGQASEGGAVGCPESPPTSGDPCSVEAADGAPLECSYPGGACNSSSSGGSVEVYFTCTCTNGTWGCGGWGC